MEPGCPSGGGGYPLSGAPGWGGRSRGEGGGYSAGRRGVAVAGRGCPSEREAPSGGRDQRPLGARGRSLAGTPNECVSTEKYHVKQSAESRL